MPPAPEHILPDSGLVAAHAQDSVLDGGAPLRKANELTRTSVELAAERAARDTAERTVERQMNEIARTSAELTAERASRAAAERAMARQANEIARAAAVTAAAKTDTGVIARRVSRRWRIAAGREIAAAPAEALPVIGTSVIVAATTWEIRDMCATVRDMSELERLLDPNAIESDDVATVCGAHVPDRKELTEMLAEAPGKAWETAREYFNDPEMPDLPNWEGIEEKLDGWGSGIRSRFKDNWNNLRKWYDGADD